MSTTDKKFNIYQEVTNRIIARLNEGDIPWRKPWNAPNKADIINYDSRLPYQGINRWLLNEEGEYLTFNQCRKHGGRIKKGEKAKIIIKYGLFIPKKDKELAKKLEEEGKSIEHLQQVYLKYDSVFHISQTEGIKSLIENAETKKAQKPTDIADILVYQYSSNENIKIQEEETDISAYNATDDIIIIPKKEQFLTEEEYYKELFLSFISSTSNIRRCNRKTDNEEKEELVKEIGASMLMNSVELKCKEADDNTIAKIKKWTELLENDSRLIIFASSLAEKATKYVLKPIMGE